MRGEVEAIQAFMDWQKKREKEYAKLQKDKDVEYTDEYLKAKGYEDGVDYVCTWGLDFWEYREGTRETEDEKQQTNNDLF